MKYRLLPPAFKIVGISVILLAFLVPLTFKLLNTEGLNKIIGDKTLFRQIAGSIFLSGFLLIILAREKMEDEFVDFCRLTAFRFTFIFGLISVILNSFSFLKNTNLDSSFHLLLIQCIFYIIIFYAAKKGLIRYEK